MHYLVNDISLAGQFAEEGSFRDAVTRIMIIRNEIIKYGVSLYCHRKLAHAEAFDGRPMQQAVAALPVDQKRALMQWLTTQGPHWEDEQVHSSDDWYDVNDTVVTDTGVAEAAAWVARGLNRETVSFDPSDWLHTPITVNWVTSGATQSIDVRNHWQLDTVRLSLEANATAAVNSWESLASYARRIYSRLDFGTEAFHPLRGHPFHPGVSDRILIRLNILNKFKGCFTESGDRTPEGDYLNEQHFTGGKAWFTDSSDGEKREFFNELHFPHPKGEGDLFCTWHGKIKTPQYRIHFTFPIVHDKPLYVMYVGPKITKR